MTAAWEAVTPAERARSLEARHRIFCAGITGEQLEVCRAEGPGKPHDRYDTPETLLFGSTYRGRDVATGRAIIGPDLPTAAAFRKLGLQLPDDLTRWLEPSRVGLEREYQGTRLGREVLLGLVGTIIRSSLLQGYEHWLLTMRELLFRALYWFPYDLGRPFLYPGGEGGPQLDEPIFSTVLYVPEIVIASWYLRPEAYRVMFPAEPTLASWNGLVDGADIRSVGQLTQLAAANRRSVQAHMAAWKMGSVKLPVVGG